MLHNLKFDFGPHLIWCEMEINISLDVIDEKPCVIWDGDMSTMEIDTLKKNIQVKPMALRKDNFFRMQQAIEEKVAEMTIAEFNEIQSNNKER